MSDEYLALTSLQRAQKLHQDRIDFMDRKCVLSKQNAFAWSSIYNISGMCMCVAPFVFFGMFCGPQPRVFPKSIPIAAFLTLAFPLQSVLNLHNKRALFYDLNAIEYWYQKEMLQQQQHKDQPIVEIVPPYQYNSES
jgi:hypothetical protein